MLKTKNLFKIALVTFVTIIMFAGCSSDKDKIGFKGMYLGENADNVCSVIEKLANDNKAKFIKKKKFCRADLKLNGAFSYDGFLTAYIKDNHIVKLDIGDAWSKRLFNANDLSDKNFAQALVNSKDWINKLEILRNPVQAYYSSASDIYGHTNTKDGWKIKVIGKHITLTSIGKASF